MEWNSDFSTDLEFAKQAEKYTKIELKKKYPNTKRITGYHKEYDIIVPEVDKTIEVKSDRRTKETGNLFIEYESRGKPSGISTTKADVWFYYIEPTDFKQVIMIRTDVLKKLIKENFSVVGGVVSTPAINAGYGSLSQIVKEKYGESSNTQRVSSEQVSEALKNYNKLGETLYQQQTLKETAKSLSQIAEMAATHTLQETEDWFDKVTVSRNMKALTTHSKAYSKIAEEASSVQQRLAGLYEDMGNILNRYYEIPESEETHMYGHDDDDRDSRGDTIKEGDYEEFFQKAMKKFGIKSPDELESDEKKKEFFNYVDKNYKAKSEGRI